MERPAENTTIQVWEEKMVTHFRAYVSPILVLLGIPINILIILAFASCQREQQCRFNVYAMAVAMTHILLLLTDTLFNDFMGRGLKHLTSGKYFLEMDSINSISCKLFTYWSATASLALSGTMVVFSVDEIYTVNKRTKETENESTCFAIFAVTLTWVLSMMLNVPNLLQWSVVEYMDGSHNCRLLHPESEEAHYITFLFLFGATLVPTSFLLLIEMMSSIRVARKLLIGKPPGWSQHLGKCLSVLILNFLSLLIAVPTTISLLASYNLQISNMEYIYPLRAKRLTEWSFFFISLDSVNYVADFITYFLFMPTFRGAVLEIIFCKIDKRQRREQRSFLTRNPSKCLVEDCSGSPCLFNLEDVCLQEEYPEMSIGYFKKMSISSIQQHLTNVCGDSIN